jgi:unsaturated chondroitin disaccharide hydrolase
MKNILTIAIGFLFLTTTFAQSKSKQSMASLIDEQMLFAKEQYKVLAKNVPADKMPKALKEGKVETSNTKWWCSGFFPGSLLYIYEYTQDAEIKAEAERRLGILEKEKHYTGNHDLGFMMYCSFGNAYRLWKKPEDKRTIDTAAMSLSTRYRPTIKVIQSWNSSAELKCPIIIDNMMNLELLCWVTDNGGDAKFKDIAITHANTTMATHFRPDYSSYHVLDYNLETAKLERKITRQGYADESAWARGQAWGLYGYITMYRFTRDLRYLDLSKKIAAFLLNHPNKTADMVPYWDYNAPNIPNALRDASAGAITASALLELGQYSEGKERAKYVKASEKIIRSLASSSYRAKKGENGGFLLMHSVGHFMANSEVDTPLTYADYYFLEAMKRYKDWYLKK